MYPQVFGKYVLERELSRGGMARVVLATLRGAGGFEKKLVVKQIRDELAYDQVFVRRFVEEAKTTVALSHPNIVPVYELGVEQGTYFLAMELVEGVSITELLCERNEKGEKRVLSPEEGAYVGIEVCRALDYAHRRMKVVHRDITPRNVMLDEEGQVKLIDFGIAAPARVAGHEILGSPGHMSPEQIDGKELGPATDLFALAVLLMEAWSGQATFRRATPEECDAALRGTHPRPSDYDPRLIPLDDLVTSCLELDPEKRPKDASEVGRALRIFLQSVDTADIASALGQRVRDLREEVASPSPPSRELTQRLTLPSQGDFGTKTFAAREEALRWSSPSPAPSFEPAEESIDSPSTRRLESVPPKQEVVSLTPHGAPLNVPTVRRKKTDSSLSIPTPLMIEPFQTFGRSALASPVRPPSRGLQTPEAKRARRWMMPVLAGFAVASGLAAWKATKRETVAAPARPVPAEAATSVQVAPIVTSATPVPPPLPTPSVTAITSVSPSITSVSSSAAVGRATLLLLGELGTRVSVDGVSRGACPVRLNVEPGPHEARFSFDPTGESRGERILVKAGDKLSVRAEFTGASPTVKIQR